MICTQLLAVAEWSAIFLLFWSKLFLITFNFMFGFYFQSFIIQQLCVLLLIIGFVVKSYGWIHLLFIKGDKYATRVRASVWHHSFVFIFHPVKKQNSLLKLLRLCFRGTDVHPLCCVGNGEQNPSCLQECICAQLKRR